METTLLAKHRLLVMRIHGEIDHHAAEKIRRTLERELKRTGAINIALDFGRVTFMDSSGIGVIIGRYKTVQALGGQIILYDVSEQIMRLLEMAGVDNLVIISPNLHEGIKVLNGGTL